MPTGSTTHSHDDAAFFLDRAAAPLVAGDTTGAVEEMAGYERVDLFGVAA